jgi:regulator of protease activity HflC (stomatin/prohibitin superfamily)
MGAVVFAGFLALVCLGGIGYAVFGKENRGIGAAVAAVAAVLAAIVILSASVATIGTSDVGVETAYGKTVGDLPPGLHLVAPWVGVTTWDGSVQTITYDRRNCLEVRIGGQQSACLAITFQYKVRDGAADGLFRLYRTQANMNDKLVVRELDQAVNERLASFSPIEALAAGNQNGTSLVPYAQQVAGQMRSDIGTDIQVLSVFIPYASYDESTTSRLNAYQTQVADTLIAQQAEKTALAQRAANNDLASSVSNANVIAQECVTNVLVPVVKAGGNPAGINCWPGSSAGSTVVIPAK